MTIYFTADLHLGHANIIRYCHRPFRSVSEMDAGIIESINDKVGPEDILYILGDVTPMSKAAAATYFSQINGHILVIPGNHDNRWLKALVAQADLSASLVSRSGYTVEVLQPVEELKLWGYGENDLYPQRIILCHYHMDDWNMMSLGSWHLFGHTHGLVHGQGRCMDVGIDPMLGTPISLDEVQERLLKRVIKIGSNSTKSRRTR